MNSKVTRFDESKRNFKGNNSDEQPLRITDVLYEDDLRFLDDVCTQLYYSTVDLYGYSS